MDDPGALNRAVAFTVCAYPAHLYRTLIQLGYEPVAPDSQGRLPHLFSYLHIIRKKHGYLSLYTGMRYMLPAVIIKKCSYDIMASAINHKKNVDNADVGEVITICIKESILRINASLITYPITTISIGYLASVFLGAKDTVDYSLEVLYKGVVPKLIFEVVMVWVDLISRRLTVDLVKDETSRAIVSRLPPFLVQSFLYPFTIVSTVMADNGRSRLHPKFDNWRECWAYLGAHNEFKRGSSFFWRRANGPIPRPFTTSNTFSI